jgi:hypothetical protein
MYSVASTYFDYIFADVEFFKKIWDLEQEHESQAKINLWQAIFQFQLFISLSNLYWQAEVFAQFWGASFVPIRRSDDKNNNIH